DWPQYVTPEHPHADEILERDVSNILTHFFRKYGIKRELDETIREIKSEAGKSIESKKEGAKGWNEGTSEEDIFQEEDFEAENFEAESFEAEEIETEDLKTQNFEKAASKKGTSDK
ncbi:MAG TPA: RIO1 family regulatory kinase/ATPase, partial [Methanosarcina sp.]